MLKIQDKLRMPETIIAVVGDTGSGKSSLMNALLDHADILPTSGMRACTAVVVEITNNRANNNYEADIEFLSEKVGICCWILFNYVSVCEPKKGISSSLLY